MSRTSRQSDHWERPGPTRTSAQWTDEELMALPEDGFKRELVNGEIVMSPAGANHGRIIMILSFALEGFVTKRKLGAVFDGQTGFRMRSGDLFSPDISFMAKSRLEGTKRAPQAFFRGSPELAVEVLSPGESFGHAEEKIAQYFENDTKLAWLVNPVNQTVQVYRGRTPEKMLRAGDVLDGEDILPGFTFPVADLFAEFNFDE
jgi:Uma2 family endonuclease